MKEVFINKTDGENIVAGAKDMIVQDWGVVLTRPLATEEDYQVDPNRVPLTFIPWTSINSVTVAGEDEEVKPKIEVVKSGLVVAKAQGPVQGPGV